MTGQGKVRSDPVRLEMQTELSGRALFLDRRINRLTGKAIRQWNLIEAGDRILVAVSGGKDSYTMLYYMLKFQRKAPVPFEIVAMNLDQGQPGFNPDILPALFTAWQVP